MNKLFIALFSVLVASQAFASNLIDIFMTSDPSVPLSDTLYVNMNFMSEPQTFAGAQVLIQYDPNVIILTGFINGEYPWMMYENFPFLADNMNINENIDDGEAAAIFFGDLYHLPQSPLFVGSFVFKPQNVGSSLISINGSHGPARTLIAGYGGSDLTGELFDVYISVAMLGDCNCDNLVDFDDISYFISILSGNQPCNFYNADINQDGVIDFDDTNPLINILSQF